MFAALLQSDCGSIRCTQERCRLLLELSVVFLPGRNDSWYFLSVYLDCAIKHQLRPLSSDTWCCDGNGNILPMCRDFSFLLSMMKFLEFHHFYCCSCQQTFQYQQHCSDYRQAIDVLNFVIFPITFCSL